MVGRRQQPGSHRPTVSETSALAADRAQIARLDGQTLALQCSLRAVQEERAQVQERLDGYVYPIFTLPNEIVAEIFLRFLPVYPKRPPSSGVLSPMMLGQICHRWREIAWSTPALWRAISIHFTPFSKARFLPLLEGWMTRAASLPLSISLFLEEDDEDTTASSEEDDDTDDGGFRAQLVQTLVSHCSRWEHVKLVGIIPEEDLEVFVGHRMPLLRSLGLISDGWDASGDPLESVFQDVPLLRSLTLSRHFRLSFLLLPLSQLTTLVMTSAHEPVLLRILRQTVNLIHCQARLFRYFTRPEMYEKVKLEFLQSLSLLDSPIPAPSNSVFIDALTVPALRTMHINQVLFGSSPFNTLDSLLARSGCRLQTLRLRRDRSRDNFPPDDLLRAAFPTIQIIFEAKIHRQWHHVQQEEGESSEDDESLPE